jgi:DNA-binding CsgD family transcriptional regulator
MKSMESHPFRTPPPARRRLDAVVASWQAKHSLTPMEASVLAHVLRGRSNKEIGSLLGSGTATVRTHVGHLLKKLGVATRAQLAFLAFCQDPGSDPARPTHSD